MSPMELAVSLLEIEEQDLCDLFCSEEISACNLFVQNKDKILELAKSRETADKVLEEYKKT